MRHYVDVSVHRYCVHVIIYTFMPLAHLANDTNFHQVLDAEAGASCLTQMEDRFAQPVPDRTKRSAVRNRLGTSLGLSFHLSLLSHWQCCFSWPFQRGRSEALFVIGQRMWSWKQIVIWRQIERQTRHPIPNSSKATGRTTRLVFGSKESLHVFRQTPFFNHRGHSTSFLS